MRRLFILLSFLSVTPALADTSDTCAALVGALPKIKSGEPLKVGPSEQTYKSLYDVCDRTDKFAGKMLPMHSGRPLTCSSDPNRVAYLNRFASGTIAFSAKAAVDADGSKYACGSKWPNQCGTWLEFDSGSERRDVNAEDTPFVVVPTTSSRLNISFQKDTGIGKGDLAVVVYQGKCAFGVVGDAGPYFRLGEISLRAFADLGHPRCRTSGQYPCKSIIGSGFSSDVHYLIFPASRPVPLTSQNVNEVARKAAEERTIEFVKGLR